MWSEIVLLGYLLMLSVLDTKNKTVPATLLIIGMVMALMHGIVGMCNGQSVMWYILGSIPGAVLLLIAWTSKKAGYGDGIVLMIMGVLVGYYRCVMIWGISLFMVSLCAVVLLGVKKAQKNTQLPYIPFLSGSYLLWWMLGGNNV